MLENPSFLRNHQESGDNRRHSPNVVRKVSPVIAACDSGRLELRRIQEPTPLSFTAPQQLRGKGDTSSACRCCCYAGSANEVQDGGHRHVQCCGHLAVLCPQSCRNPWYQRADGSSRHCAWRSVSGQAVWRLLHHSRGAGCVPCPAAALVVAERWPGLLNLSPRTDY